MKKNSVLIISCINYQIPPRIPKILKVLDGIGFGYKVVYWDRKGTDPDLPFTRAFRVKRRNRLWNILQWYLFFTREIIKSDCGIVQPNNFDTAFIVFLLKPFKKYKIVYDIRDSFAYMLGLKNKWLIEFVRRIDNLFMHFADRILMCDEARTDYLTSATNRSKIEIIMNVPMGRHFIETPVRDKKDDPFVLNYSGRICTTRGLFQVADAIRDIPGIVFEFAEGGNDLYQQELVAKLARYKNTRRLGSLSNRECIRQMARADLILAFYDPTLEAHKYPNSNKVFEAMMLKIPILTNYGTSLAEFVEQNKIGLVTAYDDVEQIRSTIRSAMAHRDELREMGERGYLLFKVKYNWEYFAEKLMKIYLNLAQNTKKTITIESEK